MTTPCSAAFVDLLGGAGERFAIETQCGLPDGSIPDITIRGAGGFVLYVEVKVDAPFDAGQINRYLDHGQVAALLRRSSAAAGLAHDRFVGATAWPDVAQLIRDRAADDDAAAPLTWLLRLLEHHGLVRTAGQVRWQPEGEQDVEDVERICGVMREAIEELSGDLNLSERAPPLYRLDDGIRVDWRREKNRRAGTIAYCDAALRSRYSHFADLWIRARFDWAEDEPTFLVGLIVETERWCGEKLGTPLSRSIAEKLAAAGGSAAGVPTTALMRAEAVRVLGDACDAVRAGGVIDVGAQPKILDKWGSAWWWVSPLEAVCSPGIDADELRAQYGAWLREIIGAFFDTEPERILGSRDL